MADLETLLKAKANRSKPLTWAAIARGAGVDPRWLRVAVHRNWTGNDYLRQKVEDFLGIKEPIRHQSLKALFDEKPLTWNDRIEAKMMSVDALTGEDSIRKCMKWLFNDIVSSANIQLLRTLAPNERGKVFMQFINESLGTRLAVDERIASFLAVDELPPRGVIAQDLSPFIVGLLEVKLMSVDALVDEDTIRKWLFNDIVSSNQMRILDVLEPIQRGKQFMEWINESLGTKLPVDERITEFLSVDPLPMRSRIAQELGAIAAELLAQTRQKGTS